MAVKFYKIALKDRDPDHRVVEGRDIKIADYLRTFYYHDTEEMLFVICEHDTGRSIGYGSTLKSAKEMATNVMLTKSENDVLFLVTNLPQLNEA